MYLTRKVDSYLRDWRSDDDRLPLIVKGPRQVGKTESILHFARNNYDNVVSINFALEPKYRIITDGGYTVTSVIKSISLLDPTKRFVPGRTLLFFDELQEHPDIATTLKAFKLDGRYDVICSGSMLGINYKRIESVSVGYKTDYEMRSLDFEEYLWACGYDLSIRDDILEHMLEMRKFSRVEQEVYGNLFLDYCALGGMPAVVNRFVE